MSHFQYRRAALALISSGFLWHASPGHAQVAGALIASQQKISATGGGFGGALGAQAALGSALAPLGDLDGDGIGDVAVGAPGAGAGAVWVLFLGADGGVRSQLELGASGFGGVLDGGDAFGAALAALGDLDGDGVPELAVGAPGDDDGGHNRGAVWVLFLRADGSVKGQQKLSSASGEFPGALNNNAAFGAALAALGDLDGDTTPDVAVGVPGDDDGGSKRGAVWQLFLDADGSVGAALKISQTSGGFGGTLPNTAALGSSLASVGDLDDNGVRDLAAGAPGSFDAGQSVAHPGVVWLLLLASDGSVLAEHELASPAGGALDASDGFGASAAELGDLDRDGVHDLAVGAPLDSDGGSKRGSLWLLFLTADGSVKNAKKISSTSGGFGGALSNGDAFGVSIAALGDLDSDGAVDLAVGASGADDGGNGLGALWTLFTTGGSADPFLGSGINPNLLVNGQTLPKLGKVWDPVILAPSGDGDPLIDFLGVSTARADEFIALDGPFSGQLLISIAPGDVVLCTSVPAGQHFAIPIPDDPNLIGLPLYSQGAMFKTSGVLVLTNGLDIVLGF